MFLHVAFFARTKMFIGKFDVCPKTSRFWIDFLVAIQKNSLTGDGLKM